MSVIVYILIAIIVIAVVYSCILALKRLDGAIDSIGKLGREIENTPLIISDHIYSFYFKTPPTEDGRPTRYSFTGAQLLTIIQTDDLSSKDLSEIAPVEILEKVKAKFNRGV